MAAGSPTPRDSAGCTLRTHIPIQAQPSSVIWDEPRVALQPACPSCLPGISRRFSSVLLLPPAHPLGCSYCTTQLQCPWAVFISGALKPAGCQGCCPEPRGAWGRQGGLGRGSAPPAISTPQLPWHAPVPAGHWRFPGSSTGTFPGPFTGTARCSAVSVCLC